MFFLNCHEYAGKFLKNHWLAENYLTDKQALMLQYRIVCFTINNHPFREQFLIIRI
jgi:hypothetical protein